MMILSSSLEPQRQETVTFASQQSGWLGHPWVALSTTPHRGQDGQHGVLTAWSPRDLFSFLSDILVGTCR